MHDLRKKIGTAKTACVEKQRIEAAELKVKQHEDLMYVAAGAHAI